MTSSHRTIAAIWLVVLLTLLLTAIPKGDLTGDGREYLLYAHAFATHASPDLRAEDLKFFNDYMENTHRGPYLDFLTLGEGRDFPSGGAHFDGKGFIRTQGGQVYSWHFWLYSLCVAPFLMLVSALGGKPETAFVFCNWSFLVLTFSYMLHCWKGSIIQKWLLGGLFLLGGTTYYLWWTHPEVLTASLLLLGLMAFTDKRYRLAIGATSIAATQNPPLIFLLASMSVWIIWNARRYSDHENAAIAWNWPSMLKRIAEAGIALAFSLTPVAFYWSTCKVTNPIAAAGWADVSLVSIKRLAALYFDLNMGMIVALPATMLAGTAFLFSWLIGAARAPSKSANVSSWGIPLLLGIAISVTMALPSLSSTNWNHGQTVFGRYAYWLAIPITFGLVLAIARLGHKTTLALVALLLIGQAATVSYYGFWGKRSGSNFVVFKQFAIPVMLHYPSLYNPLPEIFAERLLGIDLFNPTSKEGPNSYSFPDTAHPTKILARGEELAKLISQSRMACNKVKTHATELGWTYINIPQSCYRQG
ncbi:MAG: hypothetical protein JSS57_19710 [Proteobacteria bacterium]|nr:hypothetical protein [Pseudomonadota bacterium]